MAGVWGNTNATWGSTGNQWGAWPSSPSSQKIWGSTLVTWGSSNYTWGTTLIVGEGTAFQRNAFQDDAFQIDDLPTGRPVQRITTGPSREVNSLWVDEWTRRIHAINEEEKRQKLIKKLKKRKVITLVSDFFFDD